MGISRWQPASQLERVPSPAVGTDFRRVNSSGGLWVIRAIMLTLVTSVIAGNRAFRMRVESGEVVSWRTQSYNLHPVADTRHYAAFAGSSTVAGSESIFFMPFPTDGVWMRPGDTLLSYVQNLDAGDQIQDIVLDLCEYPEVLPAHLMPGPSPYSVDS